ncbi:MAG TPA: methyltransferase, partial [Fibrobacteria bacterium]|nr:methyltransferase [Fibrobacteria bacterium]
PATYALAEVLAAEPPSAFTGGVLDLGCGSGFLAAFLAARFGVRAASCDFNVDACRLAALNTSLAARPTSSSSAPEARPAATRVFCADFRAFPSRAAFGLILAGEMLYARENHGPILAFLDRHLAARGAAWLADPGRSAAEGFAAAAAAAGYAVDLRRAPSRAAGRNVDVYRLTREIPTLAPLG